MKTYPNIDKNPILTLAGDLTAKNISYEHAEASLLELMRAGKICEGDLFDAQAGVLSAFPPSQPDLVIATATLCSVAILLGDASDKIWAALRPLFIEAAGHLEKKTDNPNARISAATFYKMSRRTLPLGEDYARLLIKEANNWFESARLVPEPELGYLTAAFLYREALVFYSTASPQAGRCALGEAKARIALAGRGSTREGNYYQAFALCQMALVCFPNSDLKAVRAMISEASAWFQIAASGIDAEANFRKAIDQFQKALEGFPVSEKDDGAGVGHCTINHRKDSVMLN